MGLLDKAKDTLKKNADKVATGVNKATDAANRRTGGKYRQHLDKVDEKAKGFADQQRDTPATPPPADPTPPSATTPPADPAPPTTDPRPPASGS